MSNEPRCPTLCKPVVAFNLRCAKCLWDPATRANTRSATRVVTQYVSVYHKEQTAKSTNPRVIPLIPSPKLLTRKEPRCYYCQYVIYLNMIDTPTYHDSEECE